MSKVIRCAVQEETVTKRHLINFDLESLRSDSFTLVDGHVEALEQDYKMFNF